MKSVGFSISKCLQTRIFFHFSKQVINPINGLDANKAKKVGRHTLAQLQVKFNSDIANELIVLLKKPLFEDKDKSEMLLQLSRLILDNRYACTENRYAIHQFFRNYINNKWPCVEEFKEVMIEFLIQQFEENYTESDEGHNLLQFFRGVVLNKVYSQEQLDRIAALYTKEYMRFNLKHAVISLYYANLSGQIEKFDSIIQIIDDLSIFSDLSLLSTVCLIADTIGNLNTLQKLHRIIRKIQSEMLLKQNDLAKSLNSSRFDILYEFLNRSSLLVPGFDDYLQKTRKYIIDTSKFESDNLSHSRYLTKDQEEDFASLSSTNKRSERLNQSEQQLDEQSDFNEESFLDSLFLNRH